MPLSKQLLEKQKASLLTEKKRLEEQIAKLKEFPDYGFDPEDSISELADFQNNQSLEQQSDLLLAKVNDALEAIENGTYGQCRKCQKAIEEKRLEAMPYADLCVNCKPKK